MNGDDEDDHEGEERAHRRRHSGPTIHMGVPARVQGAMSYLAYCRNVEVPNEHAETDVFGRKLECPETEAKHDALRMLGRHFRGEDDCGTPQEQQIVDAVTNRQGGSHQGQPRPQAPGGQPDGPMLEQFIDAHLQPHARIQRPPAGARPEPRLAFHAWRQDDSLFVQCPACMDIWTARGSPS